MNDCSGWTAGVPHAHFPRRVLVSDRALYCLRADMLEDGPNLGLPGVLYQDTADEPQFLPMPLLRTPNDGLIH